MHFYRGSGVGAARYFDEGHQGAEAYYTEASKGGGGRVAVEIDTWTGGERSGQTVLAEPGDLVKWVEGVDPATGEVKGIIRAGGKDRLPLRFVEVVVTNPKSLSIVASQNPVVAAALDRVLSRQADEVARYLSAVAVTRVGGRSAQVEVGGLTVETARVRHLTSREGDPHRHIHLMLNTRVRTPEAEWRGLHSAAIRQHIRAIHELGNRVIVTDVNLREVLASEGYTLGADREIDQARGAVKLMSKRSAQVAANRERAEAAWRAEHPGREPSQRVRNGWDQQGWADGRKAKPYERETPEEMAERVRIELADAGFDFTLGAHRAVEQDQVRAVSVGQVNREQVAADVVAGLSAMKSAWSEADLTAQVEAQVAATGVVGDPQAVAELVEDVRARAAGRCVSVLDPDIHTPTVMSRHLTSAQVIDADQRLNLGLAGLAGGTGARDVEGGRLAVAGGLDEGQAVAVVAVCGGRRLEVIIGPAGTGKTRMLDAANRRLAAQGREMVVVAPTRKAALVAGAEVGAQGAALSKLLYDQGFRWDPLGWWTRLEVGQTDPVSGRVHQGPSGKSVLSERSVVVVDEAGLMTVDQANALIDIAAETGAAVRLVGDPRQLGAVGRGGVMETASRWVDGGAVTLDQVHRFLTVTLDETGLPATATDVDYAALSLLLRDGDRPEVAVDRLVERGAVVVHASQSEAVTAIAGEVAAQGQAVTVTVATNDDAAALNTAVRDLRVQAGQVDDTHTAAGMDGTRIGAGDRIVTRRNDTGRDVANRETWTVETVTADGAVIARPVGHQGGQGRQVRLDADYLAAHTQLAYATTDYGNQGVTTDRAVTWVTETTTAGGLYVGATRGRCTNTLHVVADNIDDARSQLVGAAGRDRADRGLDMARTRAEADAVPARPNEERRASAEIPLRYEPEHWRTNEELDAAAEAAHARLEAVLQPPPMRPVLAEAVWERDNQTDRDAAAAARAQSVWHRGEAARIHADRDRLTEQATVEYLAAREDSRIIQAGPGRFGRKTGRVEEAQARRAETARRWADPQLPGAQWTDDTVRRNAQWAAEQAVAPHVRGHMVEADRHDQAADTLDHQIAARDRTQQTAIRANERAAAEHDQRVTNATAEVDKTIRAQDLRAQLVEAMTPTEEAACDAARAEWRTEQDRHAAERASATVSASRDPIERAHQAVAAKAAREAALARQLGVRWDPDATGTAKARQAMTLQQAVRARDLAQQRVRGPSHDRGIEM